MTELRIIANVTSMGILISTILLPIFYPDNWSINYSDVLQIIILSLMLGSFYFLIKEATKK